MLTPAAPLDLDSSQKQVARQGRGGPHQNFPKLSTIKKGEWGGISREIEATGQPLSPPTDRIVRSLQSGQLEICVCQVLQNRNESFVPFLGPVGRQADVARPTS